MTTPRNRLTDRGQAAATRHGSRNKQGFYLPPGAEYYVALQRTAYQHPLNVPFRLARLGSLYDRHLLSLVERRRRYVIANRYTMDMGREFGIIRPHLPLVGNRIIDIGCGIGGIDVLLARHYDAQHPHIHLLDKSYVSGEVHYGFREQGAVYNSLELARSFVIANGVPNELVHAVDADELGYPRAERFDLVISLLSWGFHYPLATYLDAVQSSLSPNGVVIVDVRHHTGQYELLTQTFPSVTTIHVGPKHCRLVARR